MTYLELVNSVLQRLREDTVSTVTENAYSALVGEFVNDAKRKVEAAWQWSDLLGYITIPLVTSTAGYATNGLNFYNASGVDTGVPPSEYARLVVEPETESPICILTTSGKERLLEHRGPTQQIVRQQQAINAANVDPPTSFTVVPATKVANSWSKTVKFFPVPDASYSVNLWLVNPQDRLVTASSLLKVPEDPVIQYAYLYCLYERGEEIGEGLTLTAAKADIALADAIMHDQLIQKHTLQFTAV